MHDQCHTESHDHTITERHDQLSRKESKIIGAAKNVNADHRTKIHITLDGEEIFNMIITGKAKSRSAVWLLPNFVKSRPPGCDCKRHKWHTKFYFLFFKMC